jgi:hypothetical protein
VSDERDVNPKVMATLKMQVEGDNDKECIKN